MKTIRSNFPPLHYGDWKETLDTLHMWMQVVGKVKLVLCPFINHWWHVAFNINSYGISSGPIPYNDEIFEAGFDFINHTLVIHKSDNNSKTIALESRTVAEFYKMFMDALSDIKISVSIDTLPSEFSDPIAFEKDTLHSAYNREYVFYWWRIMVNLSIIFERFRSTFRGKSSPIQFFWGSFDLNGTRFSGKVIAPPDYGGKIMRFAENEENYSFGFWPGDNRFPFPALYAYIYPAPAGIESVQIKPSGALFDNKLSEFILPYSEVLDSSSPDSLIMDFLESTYYEGAKLAGWNVKSLKCEIP
jgi:hypothetical protein